MALIIYLQILLLLFLPQLQKFYFYYDKSVQLQMAIYFQFYHNLINLKHTLLLLILLFILRFKDFFQNFFSHELPSTLYNQNLYRADKLHLTTKGNEILVRWFNHCLTISTSTMQRRTKPTRMPSSLQDVPPTFVIIDTDCPPLPAPSQLTNPTFLPPCRYSKQSLTPPCTCTSNSPKSGLIPF